MLNWEEFLSQAQQDIVSCETLRRSNDYGNSAYLLQQGLEKYIKAYLFKFQIFTGKPHELGHLPIKAMWGKLFDEIERRIRTFNNPDVSAIFHQSTTIIKQITELFEKIKNPKDRTWKIAYWKQSMKIPLNSNEGEIIKQESERLEREINRIIPMGQDLIEKMNSKMRLSRLSVEQKERIEKEIVAKTGIKSEDLSKIMPTIQSGLQDTTSGMPDMFLLLKYIIKQDNPSNDPSAFETINMLRLAWLFSFRNEIVQTFAHEDIGRYPIEIDGKSSRVTYEMNADSLDSLIVQVKNACKEIESVLK